MATLICLLKYSSSWSSCIKTFSVFLFSWSYWTFSYSVCSNTFTSLVNSLLSCLSRSMFPISLSNLEKACRTSLDMCTCSTSRADFKLPEVPDSKISLASSGQMVINLFLSIDTLLRLDLTTSGVSGGFISSLFRRNWWYPKGSYQRQWWGMKGKLLIFWHSILYIHTSRFWSHLLAISFPSHWRTTSSHI